MSISPSPTYNFARILAKPGATGGEVFPFRKRDLRLRLHRSITVLPDDRMRQRFPTSLNRLCDISDWRFGPFQDMLCALNEVHVIHRKQWEYASCILGLGQLGAVSPSARAISVGAGCERPLFYFANKIARGVAADLYGKFPGNEAPPDMLTNPQKYAPFEYRKDQLLVEYADALGLPHDDSSFDFAFCLSSIEHFGGVEQTETAMHEMHRVLKPGGFLCLTTELILTRGTLPEAYTLDQLSRHIIHSTPFSLVDEKIDLALSASLLHYPIDLKREDDLHVSPHIIMKKGGELFASLILFLRKPL